jgi:hypothetical protein
LLSKITFGSFLVYAPRGTSEVSNRAKQFVRALKEERFIGTPPQSPSQFAARRLAERHPDHLVVGRPDTAVNRETASRDGNQ